MSNGSDDGLFSFATGLVLFFVLAFVPTFLIASLVIQTVLKLANGVGDWERAFTIGAWIGVAVGGWYTTVEAVDYTRRYWREILKGMLMLVGTLMAFVFFGWLFDRAWLDHADRWPTAGIVAWESSIQWTGSA